MDLVDYLERCAIDVTKSWHATDNALETPEGRIAEAESALASNAIAARLFDTSSMMICMVIAPDEGDTELPDQLPDDPLPVEESPNDDKSEISTQR